MTTQEFLNKLQRTKLKIKEDDTPLKLGSYSAIALQSQRIFTDGRASDGSQIGSYSTKDIWINPDKTVPRNKNGFSPLKGKTGNTEFKTNPERVRKSSYFEGWAGFRQVQGLQAGHVDLNFTGELFFDFCNPRGGAPTTRKVSNTEYVTSIRKELNQKKFEGAETRFNKEIGKLTAEEKEKFYDVVRFELRKLIQS